MAGRQRPSFLKRQKEQARTARASEKRDARRARKQGRLTENDESGENNFGGDSEAVDAADGVTEETETPASE